MPRTKPPCFNCKTEDRYFACQDTCPKKLEWNEQMRKQKEAKYEYISTAHDMKALRDSMKKHRRSNGVSVNGSFR